MKLSTCYKNNIKKELRRYWFFIKQCIGSPIVSKLFVVFLIYSTDVIFKYKVTAVEYLVLGLLYCNAKFFKCLVPSTVIAAIGANYQNLIIWSNYSVAETQRNRHFSLVALKFFLDEKYLL